MAPGARMITLDSDIFKCCQELKTLGWENDAEAKRLLKRAADQVKPIMARRKWAVPILTEFYPPAPNLLGLNHNHGERIDIRLRSPSSCSTFLPYNSILGTLLHELAHIGVGPHNAAFYKLLDELNKECEELIASGNDGSEGAVFVGKGNRLGDWSVRTVPIHMAREKAVLAAQKRQRVGAIMSRGSSRRLGGSADIARLCDPREMALAAAERRRADEIWCGSARNASSEAPNDDVVVIEDENPEVIVISDDEPQSAPRKEKGRRPAQSRPRQSASRVPVRQNPAALAALRRAGNRG